MELQLHKMYCIDEIEEIVNEHKLVEKRDDIFINFDSDSEVTGEIGEITMPLYFNDEGTIACNFILVGYSARAFWRCIYICRLLSKKQMEEV